MALTNNYQQAHTGTRMIHIGKNTKSTVISKGISVAKGGTAIAAPVYFCAPRNIFAQSSNIGQKPLPTSA